MAQTSRTLEIILRAKDYFTRTFQTAGRAFVSIVRGTFGLGFNALRSGLALVKNAVFGLGAAFAGVFALSRISAFANATLQEADALQKLAVALGTTTERMSELKAAFEFTGVAADFDQTLRGLTKAMSQIFTRGVETRQGNALEQLGVDLATLRDSDPLALLQGIAKGLEQYSSEAEKAAIMSGIFGDDFDAKLLVLLGQGEKAFLANIEAARLYGATLRGDLAVAAKAAGAQLTFLKLQFGTAFRDAVLQVAMALVPVLESLNKLVSSIRPELTAGLEAAIRMLIRFGFWLAGALIDALRMAVVWLERVKEGVSDLMIGLNTAVSVVSFGMAELFSKDTLAFFAPMASGAAMAREKLEELAAKLLLVRNRIDQISKGMSPSEFGLGDDKARSLEVLNTQARALQSTMHDLARSFAEAMGDPAAGTGEVARAMDIAQLQTLREKLAEMERQVLAQFDLAAATDESTKATERQAKAFQKDEAAADGFFSRLHAGFVKSTKTYAEFLNEVQRTTTQLIEGSFSHIEDAFVSWIVGAESFKEAFNKMTLAVLSDIARWIVHLQLLALWQSLTSSFAGGGSGDPSAPTAGTSPPPSSILPNSAGGRGGGLVNLGRGFSRGGGGLPQFAGAGAAAGPAGAGGPVVNFNISATDGDSVRRMLVQERGTIVALVRDSIATSRETRLAVRGATA